MEQKRLQKLTLSTQLCNYLLNIHIARSSLFSKSCKICQMQNWGPVIGNSASEQRAIRDVGLFDTKKHMLHYMFSVKKREEGKFSTKINLYSLAYSHTCMTNSTCQIISQEDSSWATFTLAQLVSKWSVYLQFRIHSGFACHKEQHLPILVPWRAFEQHFVHFQIFPRNNVFRGLHPIYNLMMFALVCVVTGNIFGFMFLFLPEDASLISNREPAISH